MNDIEDKDLVAFLPPSRAFVIVAFIVSISVAVLVFMINRELDRREKLRRAFEEGRSSITTNGQTKE